MKTFNYGGERDGKVFLGPKEVGGVKVSAFTVANSDGKLNEDAFSIEKIENYLWVGVFDGITSLRPLAKLEPITGARFASHFLKNNFLRVAKEVISPKDLLIRLNQELLIEAKKLGGILEDTHSLPATMATIVRIDLAAERIQIAHVGDSYVIVYKSDGEGMVVTDDRNKKFDEGMLELIKQIAKEEGMTNRQARQTEMVKRALYEMFIARNNRRDGSGSGLINGDPEMERYIQTVNLSTEGVKALLVGTDGLEFQGKPFDKKDNLKMLFGQYLEGGFGRLYELKKRSEDNDPEWKFVRYKHSDDATGVMVEFEE
jgi:serine/threonine protein phosphatase PrpC